MPEYKRARVALTTLGNPAVADVSTISYNNEMLHVGHARTLLLGSLVAREFGTPFHVRFDGRPIIPTPGGGYARWDRGEGILDTVGLLSFLGIDYERAYWTPSGIQSYEDLGYKIGRDRAEELRKVLTASNYGPDHHHVPTFLDDFLDNAPSLIIRGSEFLPQNAAYFGTTSLEGAKYYVAMEDLICRELGVEKCEFNLPMILLGDTKMSKSLMAIVHWSSMMPFGREMTRKFLVASAICPDDPFSALDEEFAIAKLSERPYRWSWDDWARLARITG